MHGDTAIPPRLALVEWSGMFSCNYRSCSAEVSQGCPCLAAHEAAAEGGRKLGILQISAFLSVGLRKLYAPGDATLLPSTLLSMAGDTLTLPSLLLNVSRTCRNLGHMWSRSNDDSRCQESWLYFQAGFNLNGGCRKQHSNTLADRMHCKVWFLLLT